MTFRNVNAERFRWLLAHALTPDDVSRFFKDKQKALIIKGVKAQNLPSGGAARLALIQGLPSDAHRVLAEWLETQPDDHESDYRDQLLAWFKSIEANGLRLPTDRHRPLARAGLKALYAENAPDEWVSYLRTEIGSLDKPAAGESSGDQAGTYSGDISPDDLKRFASWAFGNDPNPAIASPHVADAVKFVNDLRAPPSATPRSSQVSETDWNRLLELKRAGESGGVGPRTTFTTVAPTIEAFDPDCDYTALDVICMPSRMYGTGPWFLDVLGFLRGREAISLAHSALLRALPEEGRVIVHMNAGISPSSPGVAECFRVEGYRSTKPIKVRAVSRVPRLLPVVYVPYASGDIDGVRTWIHERSTQLSARASLFVLTDDIAIRAREQGSSHLGSPQFDWTFDRWNALTGYELGQNAYVVLPLPSPDDVFECPSMTVIARRLFRNLTEVREIGVSKAQLTKLAERLADPELALRSAYIKRVSDAVLSMTGAETDYDALVSELMRSPVVQRDLDAQKTRRASEIDAEMKAERIRLENLRKETQAQQDRLDKLKEKTDARARDVKTAVKKAFDTAREKEVELVGQLALWRELLGTSERVTTAGPGVEQQSGPVPLAPFAALTQSFEPSREDVARIFRSTGLDEKTASMLAMSCEVSRRVGVPIIVSGVGARYVSLALARALSRSRVAVVDVGLGCVDPDAVRGALLDQTADLVLVRGVDHSDASLIAPDLIDLVVQRIAQPPQDGDQKAIVLCRSHGPASLPMPTELEQLSLKIELSASGSRLAESKDPEPLSPLLGKLRSRVEAVLQTTDGSGALSEAIAALF